MSESHSDIEEITESEPLLHGNPRPGYEQRKQVANKFISGDHGTFLGLRLPSLSLENSMHWEAMDNPVSVALDMCKKSVLRPFNHLLLSVGWIRIIEEPEKVWQKIINILHTQLVIGLIFTGYVIQYAACFRRDSAGRPQDDYRGLSHNTTHNTSSCQQYILSQYIFPDIIHSIAYFYSFYLFRFAQPEQLATLTERVFLQTSPTQAGFQSQGKLIRTMRALLFISIGWVIISFIATVLHMVGEYNNMDFGFMEPAGQFPKLVLLILLAVSFTMLDIVYAAVTLNYCVQCALLIVYTQSLQQKIREKVYDLSKSAKEISEIDDNLKSLNYTTALAQSIVLFNFSTTAVLGTVIILNPHNNLNTLSLVSTVLSVFCWFFILAMPIVQASRLSGSLNSLKKIGHELRCRPFVYQDTSDQDLDSFLLYTSSLNLRAKLFLVPVKTSYLCGFLTVIVFILLLLFQTGTVNIWLVGSKLV